VVRLSKSPDRLSECRFDLIATEDFPGLSALWLPTPRIRSCGYQMHDSKSRHYRTIRGMQMYSKNIESIVILANMVEFGIRRKMIVNHGGGGRYHANVASEIDRVCFAREMKVLHQKYGIATAGFAQMK